MLNPRQFFQRTVVPGDQGSALFFAMGIVFIAEASRYVFRPDAIPMITRNPGVSAVLTLGVGVLLVTPVVLHLIAAIQTLLLLLLDTDRAPVSETVQVFAYGAAPCVFVGVPIPEVRIIATSYGAYLVVLGLCEIHGIRAKTSLIAGAVPIGLVFGYGFRGFDAIRTVLAEWYII